jgi:hypothetical protein
MSASCGFAAFAAGCKLRGAAQTPDLMGKLPSLLNFGTTHEDFAQWTKHKFMPG